MQKLSTLNVDLIASLIDAQITDMMFLLKQLEREDFDESYLKEQIIRIEQQIKGIKRLCK